MIYCVEDDASIRELVLYTLRASGFEARGFAESGAFWEAMCEHVPDLVLLDIMLPGEDGITILKKLREKTGTTQRQLAEAIGVSQQSVNKYENHNIEPDIETLVRIADYFAVSVDTVIGHAEDDGELTESERLLLQKYRRLTPKRRAAVDALLDCF